jgi:hypothetical protein
MPATPHQRVNQADAIADAILVRRLTNAGLSLIASWLVVLAVSGWDSPLIPGNWVFGTAIIVTVATLAFATWTVVLGDRKAWRKAFDQASEPKKTL